MSPHFASESRYKKFMSRQVLVGLLERGGRLRFYANYFVLRMYEYFVLFGDFWFSSFVIVPLRIVLCCVALFCGLQTKLG